MSSKTPNAEPCRLKGYQRAPDKYQQHNLLLVGHQKRFWVLSCSAKSGSQNFDSPRMRDLLGALISLAKVVLSERLASLFNGSKQYESTDQTNS